MNSLLMQLLKAAIRIEKKLDELLKLSLKAGYGKATGVSSVAQLEPLSYPTQGACPLCQKPVSYLPVSFQDVPNLVLIRTCGCEPQTTQLPVKGESL
jgi:hypothetical protein